MLSRLLPAFSVRRPVTVMMLFLALLVLGALAWARIPLELMPGGFVLNKLWVWIPFADSTPRETEQSVLRPVEEQLATAPGVSSLNGRASSGSARVQLDFHRSLSMDEAYNAVVDRMERAMAELPDEIRNYFIWKFDPGDEPVIWAGISLPEGTESPYTLVNETIARRLERVPGVGEVDVWGVDPKRVFINFHLDRLLAHGVDLGAVVTTLGGDNFQLASGRIVEQGQVRYVRSLARWESVDAIAATPIKPGVTLGDIATLEYRLDPSSDINHIDGRDGAALGIRKESGANTVAVTRAVREAFAELEQDPRAGGARFVTFFDQGELIEKSLGDLLSSAWTGGICAIIVLYAFLREWRITLLIAACIPFTMLLTVIVLYFTGRSLNLLSLLGLMLAVGMVVDNAIVVVESIYVRRQKGDPVDEAAIGGTAEVNLAITLSTATTMVVFLPVILMSEDADFSFFMGELGMPVVWALGASLFVALVFTPLSTRWVLQSGRGIPEEPRWVTALAGAFARSLRWVLERRPDATLAGLAFLFLTMVVPVKSVGCQEDPGGNIGEFTVRFSVDRDATYRERLQVIETYEAWVDAHRDAWGVETSRAELNASSTTGRVYVYLREERAEGQPSREDVIDLAVASLPQVPGVEAMIQGAAREQDDTRKVTVSLRGEDTATLESIGAELRRLLKGVPGVLAVYADLEEGAGEELRLRVDRDALARSGASATTVGRTVGFALRGAQLPDFQDGGEEIEVWGRFRLEDREDLPTLLDFPMAGATGPVPLRALVEPEVAPGFGSINRQDRITLYPLTLELAPDAAPDAVAKGVSAALEAVALPDGYTAEVGGGWMPDIAEDEARTMALLLSVCFVFLLMGVLFESFVLPLSILSSIPLAFLGVFWALYLTDTPLTVMGGVGLVILVGVVVNNGIVLVDVVTRLRHEGLSRTDALVEAGRSRLRPILMTALTTIFGVIPMAVGSSTFVGIPYAPLGRVVAGGMISGTVLTLFVVPFMYSILDDLRGAALRWLGAVAGRPAPGVAR